MALIVTCKRESPCQMLPESRLKSLCWELGYDGFHFNAEKPQWQQFYNIDNLHMLQEFVKFMLEESRSSLTFMFLQFSLAMFMFAFLFFFLSTIGPL